MNTAFQPTSTQHSATAHVAGQQSWAQREIDAIIHRAQHVFEDVPEPRVEEIGSVRCESNNPAWYPSCFRSQRADVLLFDAFQARLKGVVENLSQRFSHTSTEECDHTAFFQERLARAEVPYTLQPTLRSRMRVGLYAAKLVVRKLTA